MTRRLIQLRDLAHRYVPRTATDPRLYTYGSYSWWPAHEIGHFLVATTEECHQPLFGIEDYSAAVEYRYAIVREIAATSISQRLLRRSGNTALADEEIEYSDHNILEHASEGWCRSAVQRLLRKNKVVRLPTDYADLKALLARKATSINVTSVTSVAAVGMPAPGSEEPRCRDGRDQDALGTQVLGLSNHGLAKRKERHAKCSGGAA